VFGTQLRFVLHFRSNDITYKETDKCYNKECTHVLPKLSVCVCGGGGRYAVVQVDEALCYKLEGRRLDS
jgi:hypothetical protein